jgi:hypothetical protein
MRLAYAVLLLLAVSVAPAFAQREPLIVIPGKPGVPVWINGIDASYGVVEGEFGLDRPGLVAPTVIYRPLVVSYPSAPVPDYFPRDNKKPGYGRLEIIPPANRRLPPPAPTYYRSWSSSSPSGPVTDYAPYNGPSAVGIDNNFYGGGGGGGGHHPHPPHPPGPPGPPKPIVPISPTPKGP